MILDQQNQFSSAQALSASGASTDYLDLGTNPRQIQQGAQMGILLTVVVGIAGTTPTFQMDLRTDSSSSFGTDAVVRTITIPAAKLTTGAKFFIALDDGALTNLLEFIRLFYTLGGTTPTITVTAEIQPQTMVDEYTFYKSGFAVL